MPSARSSRHSSPRKHSSSDLEPAQPPPIEVEEPDVVQDDAPADACAEQPQPGSPQRRDQRAAIGHHGQGQRGRSAPPAPADLVERPSQPPSPQGCAEAEQPPEVVDGVAQAPDRRRLVAPADVGARDLSIAQARRAARTMNSVSQNQPRVLDLVQEGQQRLAPEELVARSRCRGSGTPSSLRTRHE